MTKFQQKTRSQIISADLLASMLTDFLPMSDLRNGMYVLQTHLHYHLFVSFSSSLRSTFKVVPILEYRKVFRCFRQKSGSERLDFRVICSKYSSESSILLHWV